MVLVVLCMYLLSSLFSCTQIILYETGKSVQSTFNTRSRAAGILTYIAVIVTPCTVFQVSDSVNDIYPMTCVALFHTSTSTVGRT